ncbi:MAG TPA: phosphotransferase [Solirubrobacteraceae bacterium]|nr:phosphotransferase [Solirubrobacteraceae bacterium]
MPVTAPVEAVRALAPVLGEPDGAPVALEGGITNRNYRVRWGGRDCVLRCPGRDTALLGIDRAAEWAATQAAAAAGVGPPGIAFDPGVGCLVTEWVEGRPIEPAELRGRIPELAVALRTIHDGPALPAVFDVFAVVEAYREIALARAASPPAGLDRLADGAAAIRAALRGPEHAPVPCHNDLLASNVLDDGRRLWIVDWEYAGMGDRYFDLGNLAVNNDFGEDDELALLQAYRPDGGSARRVAALRLMRVMSDYREGMWGVVQSAVSELEFDFEGYAREHLERAAAALEDPRLAGWLEDARG